MDPGDLPVVVGVGVYVLTVDEDAIAFIKSVFFILIFKSAISFNDCKEKKGIHIVTVTGMFSYGFGITDFLKI